MTILPYGCQWIDDDDVRAVAAALTDALLTTGPRVQEFEAMIAALVGGEVVAVNSGTAALHTAYAAAGVGPGDEIVTTPLTFAATANAARYLGADVRFVDVDPRSGNLDPERVAGAIGARTKAVVAVDFAGHPADWDALSAIARERGLVLVADAAHSIGGTYRGRPVGSLADLSTFSFHPVKTVTTAEGGAVATRHAAFARLARRFRSHGLVHDAAELGRDEGPWYHEMQLLGFNYRLTDLQCALGISQLAKLASFVNRRREIAARFLAAFADVHTLELPHVSGDTEPAWHLFVLRVRDPLRRRAFFERLREVGLGVQVHYIPVYWHPYYRALGHREGECPIAEDYYRRAVSIPLYPRLTDSEVDSVVERVRAAARDVL
jgi:UDP-4-amino-4,6-dideoxy-N-acetyl-beta-L-altrosamine transaminase